MGRPDIERWQRRGVADGAVRLLGAGMLRHTVTLSDVARQLGLTDTELRGAVQRLRERNTPRRRRNLATTPPPGPDAAWCGFGRHWSPPGAFARNRARASGRQTYCRECWVEYQAGRRTRPTRTGAA